MSQNSLDTRVADVEREMARQGERQVRMETKLEHHDAKLGEIGNGVKMLLERDAKRPQAISWGAIASACGGIVAIAAVGWWLIGSSPAIVDLQKRVDKLDDPDIGRVTRIEKDLGWAPRVTKF